MVKETYAQYKKRMDAKLPLPEETFKKNLKIVRGFAEDRLGELTKRQSIRQLPSGPIRTNLSKEQAMLNELFGQKGQFWGNGQPVQINNTLTTGNGLIKSGDEGRTRRLMLP